MIPKVAAILLAAGVARRMGSCKQLLPLDHRTVIARCLETLLAAGIEETIVVVGPAGEPVARAAREYSVRVMTNVDPQGDMASSARAGRAALSPGVTGVVVALCDYPLVTAATVTRLMAGHRQHPDGIVIPCHHGRRGHPPLFPRQLLDALTPAQTLRDLVRNNPEHIEQLAVADQGVLIDMDTPADYRRVVELLKRESFSETRSEPASRP